MIKSVYFENFKALNRYSVALKDFNILVGINNCGKSTIIDGFRALHGAYRYASRLNPSRIFLDSTDVKYGYEIPEASIPIIYENIQTDYSDSPAIIKFKFEIGKELVLYFDKDRLPILYFEFDGYIPINSKQFRELFPVKIAIIPTLGPLEINEIILDTKYVNRWSSSRRAPRMFRNIWFYDNSEFDKFKDLVEKTWKGMSINLPIKKDTFSNELIMFCEENRIPREISWAGFGFQIWLQLLTHIIKAKNADLIIVDEPEIYLHPDLQHKILDLLKSMSTSILIATHSVEIINKSEPSDVLMVDKSYKSAKRLSNLSGLQLAAELIGSNQNIHLTRIARGKKILFVEGKDLNILSKLSSRIGLSELFTSNDFTVIPIEGFSNYNRISNTGWTFSKILGEKISIIALLDRDYRSDKQIASIKEELQNYVNYIHILEKKEIENYILIGDAIQKSALLKLNEKFKRNSSVNINFEAQKVLEILTSQIKEDVHSKLLANTVQKEYNQKKDISTQILEFNKEFEINWQNLEYRLSVIPGKEFLAKLNDYLSSNHKITLTQTNIINSIKPELLSKDLIEFFNKVREIKNAS